MIVRMWEARAHPECFPDLLSWVCESAVPKYEHDPAHISSEVFSSADYRIVVISKWRTIPPPLGAPPRHLVSREPHFWDFSPVDR
ncbi:MAG: hypothetical protein GEU94_09100 [Micromonosporaceae bacterium]|nr:hypothetical protein [Micromonosporaceae bacterium]